MTLRRKVYCWCFFFLMSYPAISQTAREKQVADSVFKALETRNPSLLLPLLDDSCNISNLPKGMNDKIIPAILEKYPPVTGYTINSTIPEAAGIRVKLDMTYASGKTGRPDFVLNAGGRIVELIIIKGASISNGGNARSIGVRELRAPDSLSVPLVQRNGLLYIKASLDGRNGLFLLDSGSPEMILNKAYFSDSLQPMPEQGGAVTGINGEMKDVMRRRMNLFTMGGMQLCNFQAMVMPENVEQDDAAMPFLGSIGYNTLKDFEWSFLLKESRLLLIRTDSAGNYLNTALQLPAAKYTAAVNMRRHIPVLQMKIGAETYRMGIDCGASNNVVFAARRAAVSAAMNNLQQTTLVGQEGTVTSVEQGTILHAYAGPVDFANMLTVITENNMAYSDDAAKTDIDGLLGTPFLECYITTVNYKKKQVSFR